MSRRSVVLFTLGFGAFPDGVPRDEGPGPNLLDS